MMATPAKTPAVELLGETISTSRQGVTFRRIERGQGFTVRFTIESDAYREQCRAIAEVWSPSALQWHAVHAVPASLMSTPEGLCYLPAKGRENRKHFVPDYLTLAAMIWEILK